MMFMHSNGSGGCEALIDALRAQLRGLLDLDTMQDRAIREAALDAAATVAETAGVETAATIRALKEPR